MAKFGVVVFGSSIFDFQSHLNNPRFKKSAEEFQRVIADKKVLPDDWGQDKIAKAQESAKKAGYVENYNVVKVEPRNENDPDIYLIVYYKNWAALDDATAKADALAKATEGSVAAANESTVNRAPIRRILGSWTGQELDLK